MKSIIFLSIPLTSLNTRFVLLSMCICCNFSNFRHASYTVHRTLKPSNVFLPLFVRSLRACAPSEVWIDGARVISVLDFRRSNVVIAIKKQGVSRRNLNLVLFNDQIKQKYSLVSDYFCLYVRCLFDINSLRE